MVVSLPRAFVKRAALSALLVFPAQAYAVDVSPGGSDSNPGTSEEESFATVQHAADRTAPGDTVYVMEGTYTNAQPGYTAVVRMAHALGLPAASGSVGLQLGQLHPV
jgi:hypothetical protein